ncbi:hypothetical protein B0H14DRAFT_3765989 [Mycena olivaceomarginata]|nr:hypothetical protein B0H14DRAFT_3765989 [Mycena olivaceomarginata]
MLFDPATGVHLKPWLPLADYLLALLKHDVPEAEMRKELTVQLDEFLEKPSCPPFIDTLFTVLRTNSTSPDRTRKRSFDNDERDGRPPAKGQFSRYSNGRGGGPDSRSTGGWASRVERPPVNGYQDSSPQMNPGGMGMNGGPMNGRRPQPYLPPDQRGGYAETIIFSHGDDAVVPGQLFPMNGAGGMPFIPMFAPGGVPFGMNGARMDMRPPKRCCPPPAPRTSYPSPQQEGGSRVNRSGELPVIQDLTPQAPDAPASPLDRQRQLPPHVPLQSPSSQMNSLPPEGYNGYDPARNGMNGHPMNGNSAMPMDVDMSNPMDMGGPMTHHHSGGFRGGVFNGEVHKFNPERRNDKTLVVEKIPEDKLTLEHVNDWFKRFGTVTNVAIDSSTAKALCQFLQPRGGACCVEIGGCGFNNRFVKLFGTGRWKGTGTSAPMISNIAPKPEPAPAAAPAISTPSRSKQIAEQKALMASLSTASAEEKKEIMEMTAAPAPTPATPVVDKDEDMEKKERERLDKELELHSATAKAASLGLSETGAETSWGGSYRPYRGRGRGARGYYRGAGPARGGPPRASMKLDNRPKKTAPRQAVRDWYETTGQVDSLTTVESGDIVVTFRTRNGLAGSNISLVGPVHGDVVYGSPQADTNTTPTPSAPPEADAGCRRHRHGGNAPSLARCQEEEVASGGWGDGDEDGMGML